MVGDRESGLLEFERSLDQVIDPICAVQEGIFGMTVKMNEGHVSL